MNDINKKIMESLRGDPYGLYAREIQKKARIKLAPSMIGLYCARIKAIEKWNNGKLGRWRLRAEPDTT